MGSLPREQLRTAHGEKDVDGGGSYGAGRGRPLEWARGFQGGRAKAQGRGSQGLARRGGGREDAVGRTRTGRDRPAGPDTRALTCLSWSWSHPAQPGSPANYPYPSQTPPPGAGGSRAAEEGLEVGLGSGLIPPHTSSASDTGVCGPTDPQPCATGTLRPS